VKEKRDFKVEFYIKVLFGYSIQINSVLHEKKHIIVFFFMRNTVYTKAVLCSQTRLKKKKKKACVYIFKCFPPLLEVTSQTLNVQTFIKHAATLDFTN
jgi:hypothetical protein